MAFTIPDFPLNCAAWHAGGGPPAPPDLLFMGNLAYGKRAFTQYWDWALSSNLPGIFTCLLCPALTDIRDFTDVAGLDHVEIPVGSGRLYRVEFVDDLGKGFPNEHRFAMLSKIKPWPRPIP